MNKTAGQKAVALLASACQKSSHTCLQDHEIPLDLLAFLLLSDLREPRVTVGEPTTKLVSYMYTTERAISTERAENFRKVTNMFE